MKRAPTAVAVHSALMDMEHSAWMTRAQAEWRRSGTSGLTPLQKELEKIMAADHQQRQPATPKD